MRLSIGATTIGRGALPGRTQAIPCAGANVKRPSRSWAAIRPRCRSACSSKRSASARMGGFARRAAARTRNQAERSVLRARRCSKGEVEGAMSPESSVAEAIGYVRSASLRRGLQIEKTWQVQDYQASITQTLGSYNHLGMAVLSDL